MIYHLKKLIELGIVEKGGEFYTLTNKGKEYSDRLDDDKKIVEKQATLSVIVNVVRNKHNKDVFFYIYFVSEVKGKLIEKTDFQENFWASRDEVFGSEQYDPYEDLNLEEHLKSHKLKVSESVGIAKGY